MNYYDDKLRELLSQCARKKKLEASLTELSRQRDMYAQRVGELEGQLREEQEDVDKLEGRTLSAFFYSAIGKKDEKLTEERRQAYAARAKYQAALRELDGAQEDLRLCQEELDTLGDCESRYAQVLKEKTQAVKDAGGSTAQEILTREERAAYLESQRRELREAIDAGDAALDTADQTLYCLDCAEDWGTWDLMGGGLLFDMAKHSRLDEAQDYLERLQSQLRRFKTELADVTISTDFQVNIDGFLRFADYFFDGIFADWAVLDRIRQSLEQMEAVRGQIRQLLYDLQDMESAAAKEQAQLQQEIEQLVSDTPM